MKGLPHGQSEAYLHAKETALACPIDFRLCWGETAYVIADSRPKVYIHDAQLAEIAEKALNSAKHKPERLDDYGAGHPLSARYRRPRCHRLVERLPTTATGKKIHYKVRAQATRDAGAGLLQKAK